LPGIREIVIASDMERGRSFLVLMLGLMAIPACQSFPSADSPNTPAFLDGRSHVEEGLLTLSDGESVQISFKKPFQSPPRLAIVEVRQSKFDRVPYAKTDFKIVKLEANLFKVENTHAEQRMNSLATFKWRAEGILAKEQPGGGKSAALDPKAAQDQLIARIKKAGGTVTAPTIQSKTTIIAIDLHRTKFTDADLVMLKDLTSLTTLNLYGTRITDAGLPVLGSLPNLRVLHLSDTAITDAGLAYVQTLNNLTELGLNNTRITDEGLFTLRKLTNLQTLALSGRQITDQGLLNLKGLRDLKHVTLKDTSVTPAGVDELKKALPKVQIIH
jgi:hypothetical protein